MKRFEEKVKDLVEIRAMAGLDDVLTDPDTAVEAYRFTDITSDLVAKWIEKIAATRSGAGTAAALAGFRGVGKSHFFALVGAILSRPDLRTKIRDDHVSSALGTLPRRHYTVASVKRGSGTSLLDELRTALAQSLNLSANSFTDSVEELLTVGSQIAGELPLVILIDTASERESHVRRDDGPLLGQIADVARAMGVFVGVALDDDISGADGANSAISRCFTIDYLDHEHLHKIVDLHVFHKHQAKRSVLHDVYQDIRSSVDGFKWSEQRFASLYPLHPATLDLAPVIRLYIQNFAILRFASDAGQKLLGRPVNSLIGLDELFDLVEKELRLAEELKEVWGIFDKLEADVVEKSPVVNRLRSKLVLRALFLLSLRGHGASAAEIAASMMIDGDQGVVDGILRTFAESDSGALYVTTEGKASEPIYWLKTQESQPSELEDATNNVDDNAIWDLLLRHTADKFSDFGARETGSTQCVLEWRGGLRRGEIVWDADSHTPSESALDWRVVIMRGDGPAGTGGGASQFTWRMGDLKPDEERELRRQCALQSSSELRSKVAEGSGATLQTQPMELDRIWRRIFLDDSVVERTGVEFKFDEDMASAHTLSQLFSSVLTPAFDQQFPDHPFYGGVLGPRELGKLIGQFLGGEDPNAPDIQLLAENFAAPLGVATHADTSYVPQSSEALLQLEAVRIALGGDQKRSISLSEMSERTRCSTVGLTREGLYLLLAALVAQKSYEFVTSSGNRINHRSLDLQIIWDDIDGIAPPSGADYSSVRLAAWADLLTGAEASKKAKDVQTVQDQLAAWLKDWRSERLLERFNGLSDQDLNLALWRTATSVKRSFGGSADAVSRIFAGDWSVDDALRGVADLFSDSEEEFRRRHSDLDLLRATMSAIASRRGVERYIAAAEITSDREVEIARKDLISAIRSSPWPPPTDEDDLTRLWLAFQSSYIDHFVARHDGVLLDDDTARSVTEFTASESWANFAICSMTPWFDPAAHVNAYGLLRTIRAKRCVADLRSRLKTNASCACEFRVDDSENAADLFGKLRLLVESSLNGFRQLLRSEAPALRKAASQAPESAREVLESVLERAGDAAGFGELSAQEIRVLKMAHKLLLDHSPVAAVDPEVTVSTMETPAYDGVPADLFA